MDGLRARLGIWQFLRTVFGGRHSKLSWVTLWNGKFNTPIRCSWYMHIYIYDMYIPPSAAKLRKLAHSPLTVTVPADRLRPPPMCPGQSKLPLECSIVHGQYHHCVYDIQQCTYHPQTICDIQVHLFVLGIPNVRCMQCLNKLRLLNLDQLCLDCFPVIVTEPPHLRQLEVGWLEGDLVPAGILNYNPAACTHETWTSNIFIFLFFQ